MRGRWSWLYRAALLEAGFLQDMELHTAIFLIRKTRFCDAGK